MTTGRRRDKAYTGYHGVAEDRLRALNKLRKTLEGQFGRTGAPFQEQIRACIEAGRCPWCDTGPYKVLAQHTLRAHAVTGDELREMAGFIKTARICDPEYSEMRSRQQKGKRLPDAAYDPNRRTGRRVFSEAGKAVQRAKLDAVRSPEQMRAAGQAFAAKTAERNAEKYAEIARLFGEGLLIQDIAQAVGLHSRTVTIVLRRAGLLNADGRSARGRNPDFRGRSTEWAQRARALTSERSVKTATDRLARFNEMGGTWDAVGLLAAEWGVSKKSAAHYLKRHGAQVPDGRTSR